jgi:CubicO group peptidase (beta-lactamase class C family)
VSRRAWLRDNLPARVRAPGVLGSYSNYGTALAGYIVERVSGVAWEQYLEERILGPLGMAFAAGRQPLPDRLGIGCCAGPTRPSRSRSAR